MRPQAVPPCLPSPYSDTIHPVPQCILHTPETRENAPCTYETSWDHYTTPSCISQHSDNYTPHHLFLPIFVIIYCWFIMKVSTCMHTSITLRVTACTCTNIATVAMLTIFASSKVRQTAIQYLLNPAWGLPLVTCILFTTGSYYI